MYNINGGVKMIDNSLRNRIAAIAKIDNLHSLESERAELIGKSGIITLQLRQIATMPADQKKEFASAINTIKVEAESALTAKKKELLEVEQNERLKSEWVDLTLHPRYNPIGSMHPITAASRELMGIFSRYGFEFVDGPNIDTTWYNFSALNMPENHPARQMHDTFYVDDEYVLRTHTSSVQVRAIQKHLQEGKGIPLKLMSCGRVYRSDYDQTHTPMFHQIECISIDESLSMAHLKYFCMSFVHQFFGDDFDVRLRPSFFSFVEPGAEVDIRHKNSDGKWVEIFGCGMVHPNVLKNAGVDAEKYSGYAIGMGVERMAMLKYGVKDLRQFFESDMRWLKEYGMRSFGNAL